MQKLHKNAIKNMTTDIKKSATLTWFELAGPR